MATIVRRPLSNLSKELRTELVFKVAQRDGTSKDLSPSKFIAFITKSGPDLTELDIDLGCKIKFNKLEMSEQIGEEDEEKQWCRVVLDAAVADKADVLKTIGEKCKKLTVLRIRSPVIASMAHKLPHFPKLETLSIVVDMHSFSDSERTSMNANTKKVDRAGASVKSLNIELMNSSSLEDIDVVMQHIRAQAVQSMCFKCDRIYEGVWTRIFAENVEIKGDSYVEIGRVPPMLSSIDISAKVINGASHLSTCKKLTHVTLNADRLDLDAETLQKLVTNSPTIEEFHIMSFTGEGDCLKTLCNLKCLRALSIVNNQTIRSTHVTPIISLFQCVRALSIVNNQTIRSTHVTPIISLFQCLRALSIVNNQTIRSTHVTPIISRFAQTLERINISFTSVDDAVMNTLAEAMPTKLVELNVDMTKVGTDGVEAFLIKRAKNKQAEFAKIEIFGKTEIDIDKNLLKHSRCKLITAIR